MAGSVDTLPEAMDGSGLAPAAGRAPSHVGHTGHSAGCSFAAPRPLCGSRGRTVEMDLELVLLNSTFNPTITDPTESH